MFGNTFGKLFRVTTFGESHGIAVGCVIDGCPAGVEITEEIIQKQLDLRRPGQSEITTDRNECDKCEILSGIFEGRSTGAPITVIIRNKDQKSNDYDVIKDIFRPSHADFTYQSKYGIRDHRGGGRTSARETIARVVAGAIAMEVLKKYEIEIMSFVQKVHNLQTNIKDEDVTSGAIFSNIVRCPDEEIAGKMIELIKELKKNGDSCGGVIKTIIKNTPVGLGSPVFNKLNADLGHAMLGINAVKGFEIGDGFASTELLGSEHNDEIYSENGNISTRTNHAGGIVGGLSNGENITFRTAFKPISTIQKKQNTINKNGENVVIENIKGRHDPCVLPRAIPIVNAMSALVLVDHLLLNKTAVL